MVIATPPSTNASDSQDQLVESEAEHPKNERVTQTTRRAAKSPVKSSRETVKRSTLRKLGSPTESVELLGPSLRRSGRNTTSQVVSESIVLHEASKSSNDREDEDRNDEDTNVNTKRREEPTPRQRQIVAKTTRKRCT